MTRFLLFSSSSTSILSLSCKYSSTMSMFFERIASFFVGETVKFAIRMLSSLFFNERREWNANGRSLNFKERREQFAHSCSFLKSDIFYFESVKKIITAQLSFKEEGIKENVVGTKMTIYRLLLDEKFWMGHHSISISCTSDYLIIVKQVGTFREAASYHKNVCSLYDENIQLRAH